MRFFVIVAALCSAAARSAQGAPPDICAAEQGLTCSSSKHPLKTISTNQPAACCDACKKTTGCNAWTFDGTQNQCKALVDCTGASAALGPHFSGSNKKLPRAQWPAAGPPVLPLPFRNTSLPLAERVRWLVANLSNSEKEGLLGTRTSSIPRLAIKSYMYYVECNSGAYANGHYPEQARGKSCDLVNLTAFPQSPGMAASFNTTLERLKGDVAEQERHVEALRKVVLGDAAAKAQTCSVHDHECHRQERRERRRKVRLVTLPRGLPCGAPTRTDARWRAPGVYCPGEPRGLGSRRPRAFYEQDAAADKGQALGGAVAAVQRPGDPRGHHEQAHASSGCQGPAPHCRQGRELNFFDAVWTQWGCDGHGCVQAARE